jgi:formamidopyrimidine-DNA glycosylase
MPEMPEIEILARQLRKKLIGKHIAEVCLSGLPLRKPIHDAFPAKLHGRTIRRVLRRGKFLIIELEPRAFWLIHLGMSGRILYHSRRSAGAKHTQAIFRFSDLTELEYRDPRRFGLLAAYEALHLSQVPEIHSLGKDPLSAGFSGKWLWTQLQRTEREIKSFLLDQRKVAGLGNIYVCESLFLARLHPARRCFTLTFEEAMRLTASIRRVLRDAVNHRGTSFSDFRDSAGKPGENQSHLMVFQREGKECARCRAPIRRIRQGNRSSFYCFHCQE